MSDINDPDSRYEGVQEAFTKTKSINRIANAIVGSRDVREGK